MSPACTLGAKGAGSMHFSHFYLAKPHLTQAVYLKVMSRQKTGQSPLWWPHPSVSLPAALLGPWLSFWAVVSGSPFWTCPGVLPQGNQSLTLSVPLYLRQTPGTGPLRGGHPACLLPLPLCLHREGLGALAGRSLQGQQEPWTHPTCSPGPSSSPATGPSLQASAPRGTAWWGAGGCAPGLGLLRGQWRGWDRG